MMEWSSLPSGGKYVSGPVHSLSATTSPPPGLTLILCLPVCVSDVQSLHDSILSVDAHAPLGQDQRDLTLLGHLTLSSMSGFPLLLVLPLVWSQNNSFSASKRKIQYFHFSQITRLRDERDWKRACCFSIVLSSASGVREHGFRASSSTDYLKYAF